MSNNIQRFIDRYGVLALIRLPVYPIVLLFWGPYRLVATLWSARVLARGKWQEYVGFGVSQSINQLFYRTQILNIDRYGRDGISPYLSLGKYPLGYWWHLSLPASYLYWVMGAVLPLASLFGWLGIHFFWFIDPNIDVMLAGLVLVLALFSSTFYANAFVVQNYNALGWILFPLGLWAMLYGYYPIATIAWFVASFGSITVVVIAGLLSISYALEVEDMWAFVTIFPAGIKISLHLYWSISSQSSSNNSPGIKKALIRTIKAIGVSTIGVKYKRKKTTKLTIHFIYLIMLYIQFGIFMYLTSSPMMVLWLTGISIFIINSQLIRFADDQSMLMMMFSLATGLVLYSNQELMVLPYWLVVSPLPLLIFDSVNQSMPDTPKPLSPYRIQVLIDKVEKFLSKVESNKRVIVAFNNPNGCYENIFDGYRRLFEIPRYVASKNKFLLFPDWWAVFENNYEDAQEFWGRDVESVKCNMEKHSADYAIIYQKSSSALDADYINSGFKVLSVLDWGELSLELRNEVSVWSRDKDAPKWWLLTLSDNV
jgi:hypothetical protein